MTKPKVHITTLMSARLRDQVAHLPLVHLQQPVKITRRADLDELWEAQGEAFFRAHHELRKLVALHGFNWADGDVSCTEVVEDMAGKIYIAHLLWDEKP